MNKQENLTSENIQNIQKTLSIYNLVMKIVVICLALIIFFMVRESISQGFKSLWLIVPLILFIGLYKLISWIANESKAKIEADMKNGFKDIIEGVIMKKKLRKKAGYFYINEEEYFVEHIDFERFEKKDNVRLEILPLSKIVISVIKIEKSN